jgi:hypothetical protein
MRGRRRRRLLCDCVTSEAYGKRSRDDEGLDHGSKPSNSVEEPIVAHLRRLSDVSSRREAVLDASLSPTSTGKVVVIPQPRLV